MNIDQVKQVLESAVVCPSKWELDNIIWVDRFNDKNNLISFLERILFLTEKENKTNSEVQELSYLNELLEDMDEEDCVSTINSSEEDSKTQFIETLARTSAIETLCHGRVSKETMMVACKLPPSDFIICAKRTQDILTSIHGLVIKGETLSQDVAGA